MLSGASGLVSYGPGKHFGQTRGYLGPTKIGPFSAQQVLYVNVDSASAPLTYLISGPTSSVSYNAATGLLEATGGSVQAAPMLKWRAALARMRNAQANAKLVMFGDSTTAGSGANGTAGFAAGGRPFCPAVKLAARMRASGITAYASGVWGNPGVLTNAQIAAWDPRLAVPTWNLNTTPSGGGWLRPWVSSTATQTIVFTPVENVDTFKIWYITASGSRIFSWAVDGGGATNVDGNNAAGIMTSVTVAAGSPGSHALTITKGSGLGNSIYGVQAYDSTNKCVEVIPWGISGSRVGDGMGATAAGSDSLTFLQTFAPDFTLINLSINEWIQAGDVGTYKTNLTTLATAAKVSGDVGFMTGFPTQASSYPLGAQQAYVAAVAEVAGLTGSALHNSWGLFGSRETDTSLYADTIHPAGSGYELGYGGIASILAQ